MYKISVIIPVYMVEEYIDMCLRSVVNQSLKDIEIIVVNDGTKDGSMAIVENYAQSDSRIKIVNKENGGLMSAWISGLKVATSDYIGFVDSDDWVDLDFFEYLYKGMIEYDADIIVGSFVNETAELVPNLNRSSDKLYSGNVEISNLIDSYLLGIFLEENIISYCRWDKLYKRELLIKNIKYLNTAISLGEDINTNIAVLPDCKKVYVYGNSPKYHYRFNDKSIVHTFNEKQIDNIDALNTTLRVIAKEKQINIDNIDIFIGNMIFEETSKILLSNHSYGYKKKLLKNILSSGKRKKAFSAYMNKRGYLHKIYCYLMMKGQILFCMLLKKQYKK